MSDVTTGKGFDSEFITHPPRWFGRVVSKESWTGNIESEKFDKVSDIKGWGYRYKIRIFGWHTGDKNILPDEQLVMANTVLPVTAGSGLGGSATTPSIEPGSVVTGFFMDAMGGQEPYIDGILGNSNNNVPKQQGGQSPQDSASKSLPSPPAPENVDQLSSTSLQRLLNPGRTPTAAEFKAASEARANARAAGLPPAEVERQVLAATVKASRSPAAAANSQSQIQPNTIGYALFNDTYKDGTNARKVPEDRIVANTPLSIMDAVNIKTFASGYQREDSIIEVPLLDVSKKNNSPMKGIQQTIKNLLNAVELLKKKFNEASAILGGVNFQTLIQKAIEAACKDISGFIKTIVQGIKSFIFGKLNENVRKITPNLFPSEMPRLYDKVAKGTDTLSCVFKNIIGGLGKLVCSILPKLLDNSIIAAPCVSQNFTESILNSILGTVTGALSLVLKPINGIFSGISGIVSLGENVLGTVASGVSGIIGSISGVANQISGAFGQLNSISGSLGSIGTQVQGFGSQLGSALSNIQGISSPNSTLLSAIDFVPGILKFFSCDTEQKAPSYNKTTQDRAASPIEGGMGLFGNISKTIGDVSNIQSQIGGIVGSITNVVGQVQSLIAQGLAIPASLLSQISGIVGQFGNILGQFESFSKGVSGSKSSSACNSGPIPSGPPIVIISNTPDNGAQVILNTAGGTGGTPITAGGTGGTPITAGGTGGTPVTVGGGALITAGGTPITAGGTGGTPITAGGTPITAGGTGGIPITAGGTGGTPVTAGGTPVTAGGIAVTVGGTGGTPITAGGTGGTNTIPIPTTGGGTGAFAIPVISPISSSIIAFDIVNSGSGYSIPPNIEIYDASGKGSGASVVANMQPDIDSSTGVVKTDNNGTELMKIKSITIVSPGDGYLAAPDGSLGGNGRVWKEVDEGYVQTEDGNYYIVQPFRPIAAKAGDTYYPPDGSPVVLKEDQIITLPLVPVTPPKPETIGIPYNVVLSIDSIEVLDSGFGYNPEDSIIITPDNGAIAELVVNDDGTIDKINITSPGTGFTDIPEIRTNSTTGFNAIFSPVLKVTRVPTTTEPETPVPADKIISVIDCVGKLF